MPQLSMEIPRGFYDGASQGNLVFCGIRVILYMNPSHYFFVHYTPGRGTNMKSKFSALWTLLHFAKMKGIDRLQVLGD